MSEVKIPTGVEEPVREVVLHPEVDISPLNLILMTAGGFCVSRALHAVADLGLADSVADSPLPIADVARERGLDADALSRVLRLLSAHGIFKADEQSVSHNDASRLLRSDHPQSLRALARMFGLPVVWNAFQSLEHSLATGRPAAEKAFPQGFWGWLGEHSDARAIFDEAMTAKAHAQVAGVVEAYDFSRYATIADIGGGRGHLLQAVLDRNPVARGFLFDLPHVVADVRELGSDRLALVGGDFFSDALPTADAYVLMEVIHDWNDADALRILSSVASAAPAGATLLLVEQLMPSVPGPDWVRMLDMHMLALFGARQRSSSEYERLLSAAGFRPTRAVETFSGATIIEAMRL